MTANKAAGELLSSKKIELGDRTQSSSSGVGTDWLRTIDFVATIYNLMKMENI